MTDLFLSPVWQRLAISLAHFAWQGFLVAVLTWALLRWPRRLSCRGRYAVALAGFTGLMACPLVTFFLSQPASNNRSELAAPAGHIGPAVPFTHGIESTAGQSPSSATWPDDTSLSTWAVAQPWMLSAWLTGVALMTLRLAIGWATVRRLRRSARPLPREWAARLERFAQRFNERHFPRVAVSQWATDALVLGLWRPLIIVPASWLARITPEVFEAVLAHELAHIRRWDAYVNLAQRVVETVLFYHPAVWWLSGVIRVERELCCDEAAVTRTADRLAYAKALELVARLRLSAATPETSVALGMGGRQMKLFERIRLVLGRERRDGKLERWSAGALVLVLPLALWTAVAFFNPAAADEQKSATDGENVQLAFQDREDGERRDGDRPREGERREGQREDGERRDGDRPREEDRPRDGERRDGERRGDFRPRDGERREGDRPFPPREGERGFGPPPGGPAELIRMIRELRQEVELLRREVRELRGRVGGERREGFREGDRDLPREGERREGDRPREGERRDGDRPREEGRRDGEGPPPEFRDGERRENREAERPEFPPREREEGDREDG